MSSQATDIPEQMAKVNIWVCVGLPQFPSPPKKTVMLLKTLILSRSLASLKFETPLGKKNKAT